MFGFCSANFDLYTFSSIAISTRRFNVEPFFPLGEFDSCHGSHPLHLTPIFKAILKYNAILAPFPSLCRLMMSFFLSRIRVLLRKSKLHWFSFSFFEERKYYYIWIKCDPIQKDPLLKRCSAFCLIQSFAHRQWCEIQTLVNQSWACSPSRLNCCLRSLAFVKGLDLLCESSDKCRFETFPCFASII